MPPHSSAGRHAAETTPSEGLPPSLTGGVPRRRPLRVGMINNPLSGQNARRGLLERVTTLLTAHPRVAHFEENPVDGMGHAVDALLRSETEIIVVNGGDGTVQAVLTALLRSPVPASLPLLAVLPGGTANTTARNVGYGRRPLRALQRLLDQAASGMLAGTVDQRAVVRVDVPADAEPQYAMLFGAGAVYHGVAFARREVESRGMRGQLGAAVAVGTALSYVATGKVGRLFPPLHAEIRIDGEAALPPEPYFGILTSTMDRQVLGLSPYWGVGPGRLRFTALGYAPRGIARAIVPALRGRPSVHLRPDLGYRSVNADEIHLTFDSGYTLDGELFEPAGTSTHMTLSARHHAYFLRERP
jgi:diacylglycerol kinase family enzyme